METQAIYPLSVALHPAGADRRRIPVVIAEAVLWRGVFQGSPARMSVLAAVAVYGVASGASLFAASGVGFKQSVIRRRTSVRRFRIHNYWRCLNDRGGWS